MEFFLLMLYLANFIEQLKSLRQTGKHFNRSRIRRTGNLRRQFQLKVSFVVLEHHFSKTKIPPNLLHALRHSNQVTTAEWLRNEV